jgi:hypothetical protein
MVAFNTARDWHDNAYLKLPGHRDRVVQILHTKHEGGLNLDMGDTVIKRLGERGVRAAQALVQKFNEPLNREDGTATGWDNHCWIRYRALLAALPEWLVSYAQGREMMTVDEEDPQLPLLWA